MYQIPNATYSEKTYTNSEKNGLENCLGINIFSVWFAFRSGSGGKYTILFQIDRTLQINWKLINFKNEIEMILK